VSIDRAEERKSGRAEENRNGNKKIRLSRIRRLVLLTIVILFLLQFLRVKALVGGLTGSTAVWFVKLLDVFSYVDSLISSKDFTTAAFLAVIPIAGIYLIFGRAFCGWVCPMDFLYELVDKLKVGSQQSEISSQQISMSDGAVSPKTGYGIATVLLIISGALSIPFFTNYLSHLTNFFRLITAGVSLSMGFPSEPSVFIFSGAIIIFLLILEFISPRLWCRVLCPVGKTYGLFNKISLLRLNFREGICGECNLCDNMCYMKVKIASNIDRPRLRDINCIYCGRCVEGCDTKGKLIKMRLWR
jgi:ferredoxin-type protein NapH